MPSMLTKPSCPPRITSLRELFVLCFSLPMMGLFRPPPRVARTALPNAVVGVLFTSNDFASIKLPPGRSSTLLCQPRQVLNLREPFADRLTALYTHRSVSSRTQQ